MIIWMNLLFLFFFFFENPFPFYFLSSYQPFSNFYLEMYLSAAQKALAQNPTKTNVKGAMPSHISEIFKQPDQNSDGSNNNNNNNNTGNNNGNNITH